MRTTLPPELLPAQRNFACGPSLVRPEVRAALLDAPISTSHRAPAYIDLQRQTSERLAALLGVPEDYTFVYVPGGATDCMDLISWSLIAERSAHHVSGRFSEVWSLVAARVRPLSGEPVVKRSAHGSHPPLGPVEGVDLVCVTLNETSTGVQVVPGPELRRPGCLVAWDGTSAAGGLGVDPQNCDALFFSPQKCFGSPAGLAVLILSPAALERAAEVGRRRAIPYTSDLNLHGRKARLHQTLNTPCSIVLQSIWAQTGWMLENGGLDGMVARCRASSGAIYRWAEARPWARPFVSDPALRSQTTATIEFDRDVVDAAELVRVLNGHGIIGTKPYKGIGQNQLRIASFPNIDLESTEGLLAAIDHLLA